MRNHHEMGSVAPSDKISQYSDLAIKITIFLSESVSSIVEGSYEGGSGSKTKIVYGVFTTPENAIGGNAICAFQISDVLDTFEGPFKEQETANSNWLPVRDMKVVGENWKIT